MDELPNELLILILNNLKDNHFSIDNYNTKKTLMLVNKKWYHIVKKLFDKITPNNYIYKLLSYYKRLDGNYYTIPITTNKFSINLNKKIINNMHNKINAIFWKFNNLDNTKILVKYDNDNYKYLDFNYYNCYEHFMHLPFIINNVWFKKIIFKLDKLIIEIPSNIIINESHSISIFETNLPNIYD
jgi:hypothetical protein